MNKQKIFIIGLIAVVVILIILSFFVGGKDNESSTSSNEGDVIYANAQKESAAIKDNEKKEFTQIDINTYLDYYKSDEQTLVLIARPTCQYCMVAEPIIQNIMYEYDLNINYLNTDNFQGDDEATLVKSDDYFSEGFGTPMLLNIAGGRIINSVDGLTDKDHYISYLKENGYI